MANFEESAWFKSLERLGNKLPKTKSVAINGVMYGLVLAMALVLVLSCVGSCSRCTANIGHQQVAEPVEETVASEKLVEEVVEEGDDIGGVTQLDGIQQMKVVRANVKRVVDGDTLVVELADGSQNKVRLIGIDTPESVHPDASKNSAAGKTASDYTKSLLPEGTEIWLTADKSDTDRYGRWLRYVWLEDPDQKGVEPAEAMLNAKLVADGYAVAKDFPPDTAYSNLFHSIEDGTYEYDEDSRKHDPTEDLKTAKSTAEKSSTSADVSEDASSKAA